MTAVPRFEDEFLESLAFAFRKRLKAIKHDSPAIDCSKVYERMAMESHARLEIDLSGYNRTSLRLWAWPDRKIWLDARQSTKKGWAWEWTYEGRLLGDQPATAVVRAFEATRAAMFRMEASRQSTLSESWFHLLAQGPKAVRSDDRAN